MTKACLVILVVVLLAVVASPALAQEEKVDCPTSEFSVLVDQYSEVVDLYGEMRSLETIDALSLFFAKSDNLTTNISIEFDEWTDCQAFIYPALIAALDAFKGVAAYTLFSVLTEDESTADLYKSLLDNSRELASEWLKILEARFDDLNPTVD